jgi:hypothetical protein
MTGIDIKILMLKDTANLSFQGKYHLYQIDLWLLI